MLVDGVEIEARARGKFRNEDIKPLVGDFVELSLQDQSIAYMVEVKDRKNAFVRPPLANIDQFFLVMSAISPDFSTILVDRFLAVVEAQNIKPIICITKMDLVKEDVIKAVGKTYEDDGYTVLYLSKFDKSSHQIIPMLKGKTSAFTGQSGVGKSTILNQIDPEVTRQTNEISKALNRGKHTTRHVELFQVHGGLVADTPGFSLLEIPLSAIGLSVAYHDFNVYARECKFSGCLHDSEPHCKVKEMVELNRISKTRYQNYLTFLEEVKNRKERYR